MVRLPFKISSEELLNSLESLPDDTEELVSYSTDVPIFLSKLKIETGEYLIRPILIYKLYKVFSKNPVSQVKFSFEAANFVLREGNYFKLNISYQAIIKILNPQVNRNKLSSHSVKKHFETFLKNTKTEKGPKWCESFLVFEVYRYYCIDNKIYHLLRYEDFVSMLKLHFEYKRVGKSKGVQFKLNTNLLEVLTLEYIEKIKLGRKKNERFKEKRRGKGKKRKEQD